MIRPPRPRLMATTESSITGLVRNRWHMSSTNDRAAASSSASTVNRMLLPTVTPDTPSKPSAGSDRSMVDPCGSAIPGRSRTSTATSKVMGRSFPHGVCALGQQPGASGRSHRASRPGIDRRSARTPRGSGRRWPRPRRRAAAAVADACPSHRRRGSRGPVACRTRAGVAPGCPVRANQNRDESGVSTSSQTTRRRLGRRRRSM